VSGETQLARCQAAKQRRNAFACSAGEKAGNKRACPRFCSAPNGFKMMRGIYTPAIYELQRSLDFTKSPLWPVGSNLWDFATSDPLLHRAPEIGAKNFAVIL